MGFENNIDVALVTFKIDSAIIENIGDTEKVGEKLTENQQKILIAITENPHIAAPELAIIVGISKRKTEDNISKLKAKNLIERIGPDKGGYWKVKV